jgi:ElaB/YqjD/DUF883 family membrane-anchored ribosome-binding protein
MGQDPDEIVVSPAASSTTGASPADETSAQVEALRGDIEQTRSDIGETLQAIEERLTPGNLAANAATTVKEKAARTMEQAMNTASERMSEMAGQTRESAEMVADRMRDSPWPAVFLGAGLGYLIYRSYADRELHWEDARRAYDYDDERYAHDERYRHYDQMQSGRRLAQRTVSGVGRGASNVGRQASSWIAQSGRMVRDNPLGFGLAAMAVGVACGLTAPETETENEWLGEARDRVVDKAKEMAGVESGQQQPSTGQSGTPGATL